MSHTTSPIALQGPVGRWGLHFVGNLLCLQAAYGVGQAFSGSISEADALSSPFNIFIPAKPVGFFSARFPFHAKTSCTSSGTKHCIKLFSYPLETDREIKHRHLPFLCWPFGKTRWYWECIRVEIWKSTETSCTLWCVMSVLGDAQLRGDCTAHFSKNYRKRCR